MNLSIKSFVVLSFAALMLVAVELAATVYSHSGDPILLKTLEFFADFFAVVGLGLGIFLVKRLAEQLAGREFHLGQALEDIKKLTRVIDTSFDGIVLTDTRGVIRHVNPKWTSITGWSAEEAEGKMTPAILKSGYQNNDFYSNMWVTIQNGKTFRGELINKRKDGGYYKVDEIVLPIKDKNDRVSGYAAFHHVLDADYKPTQPPPVQRSYTEAS